MLVKKYILEFNISKATDSTLSGGKGASLAKLTQYGFNVPDGFIITTEFFEEFLSKTGLFERYTAIINNSFDEKLLEIFKEDFIKTSIPKEMLKTVTNKLDNKIKQWNKFALRSSFTIEDSENNSFAGQGKTLLGLTNTKDIEKNIKEIYLSLFSKSSIDYIKNNHFKIKISSALIIQEFINPVFSGIIFTNWDNDILVEMVPGLGYPLVSGLTEGIRLKYDKKNYKLKDKYLPAKINSGIIENDEIKLQNIKFSGKIPYLNIKFLITDSIKAETSYGFPLDIEWTISDNKIYFLQARPITAKPKKDNIIHWSKILGEEFWSGRVTPLMFSTIGRAIEEVMIKEPLSVLGEEKKKRISEGEAIGLYYKHLYINVDILSEAFTIIPKWALTEELTKMLPDDLVEKIKLNGKNLPVELLTSFVRFIKVKFPWLLHNNYKIFDQYISKNLDGFSVDSKAFLNKENLEIINEIERIKEGLKDFLRIVVWGVTYAYISVPLTEKIFQLMVGEEATKKYSYQLFTNLPGDKNLEFIQKLNELRNILPNDLKKNPSINLLNKFKDAGEYSKFIGKWNRFLINYGHRTEERDISFPRWGEEPEIILKIISSLEDENRYQEFSTLETISKLKEKLKNDDVFINYLFFPPFITFLWLARTYLTVRENMRFYADFFLYNMRKLFLILEDRLIKDNLLEKQGDIFYLEYKDIKEYFEKEKINLKKTVQLNRAEEDSTKGVTPPDFLIGDIPLNISDMNPEKISGNTISPGIVKGNARVIKNQRDFLKIKTGEIVVLSNLDPSWSPMLINASGAIFEVGSLLSHGAIIAREYGVPSIAGVKGATEKINTGDKLLLNATSGTVSFIS